MYAVAPAPLVLIFKPLFREASSIVSPSSIVTVVGDNPVPFTPLGIVTETVTVCFSFFGSFTDFEAEFCFVFVVDCLLLELLDALLADDVDCLELVDFCSVCIFADLVEFSLED